MSNRCSVPFHDLTASTHRRLDRRLRRSAGAMRSTVALVVATGVGLMGCGGGSDDEGATETTVAETSTSASPAAAAPAGAPELLALSVTKVDPTRQYEIDGSYPEVRGLADSGAATLTNHAIGNLVRGIVSTFEREIGELQPDQVDRTVDTLTGDANGTEDTLPTELDETDDHGGRSYLEVFYTPTVSTATVLSLRFEINTYVQGAAHPNSDYEALTIDLRSGNVVPLDQLFISGARYLRVLSDRSRALLAPQLAASAGTAPDDPAIVETLYSGTEPTASKFAGFNLRKDGLLLSFPPYQVAAYALGPQEIVIKWSELAELLDPNGPTKILLQ